MVLHHSRASSVEIVADTGRVISHAGALVVQGLCDKLGLTEGIGHVFGLRGPQTIHRGAVMRDLAVAIADGGGSVVAIEALRAQRAAFGPVASDTTVWRMLAELNEDRREGFFSMLTEAREQVWADPRVKICRLLAVDVDATLVTSHTDKEFAAGTYKRGYGFHPIVVSLDATREHLAIFQRPGNAGANCADDLLHALTMGLAQLPARAFDETLHQIVVRMDSAGHSHQVVEYMTQHALRFIVGADLTMDVWGQIGELEAESWVRAIDQDGNDREYAYVAELPAPAGWGDGMRMIVRREVAHAGAPLKLLDHEGYRHQVLLTNLPDTDIAYLSALYNGRGRAEQAIDELKRCGLGKLPAQKNDLNEAWICASLLAANLLRWSQLLLLEGRWQHARIDTLRNYVLHTGARLTRHARRLRMHLDHAWPATDALTIAFARLRQMRTPTLQPI